MKIKVDFDSPTEPKAIVFAAPGDMLETEGLANCIGVVASDSQGRGAVMCHYDTQRAYDNSGIHVPGQPLKFKEAELKAFKQEMADKLREKIGDPTAEVSFSVGLGTIVSNIRGLKETIESAFEMESFQTDGTMSFDVTPPVHEQAVESRPESVGQQLAREKEQRQTKYGTFSLGPTEEAKKEQRQTKYGTFSLGPAEEAKKGQTTYGTFSL